MLFWHALGDHNSLQLIEAGPILAGDYNVHLVGVDAPGFGASPARDDAAYAVPALVEQAKAVLDELGLRRAAWLGSSWGASLGIHFTVQYAQRVSALVLLDGGYRDPGSDAGATLAEQRRHWRSHPEYFCFSDWDAVVADARSFFRRWTPEIEMLVRSAYREQNGEVVSIMGPDVYAAATAGILASPPSSAYGQLGRAGVPVLLLAATLPAETRAERAASAERFAELVPQAEIRWLDDTPHFMLEDKPERVAREVGDWLAGPS